LLTILTFGDTVIFGLVAACAEERANVPVSRARAKRFDKNDKGRSPRKVRIDDRALLGRTDTRLLKEGNC
jgi:hypothetical protein